MMKPGRPKNKARICHGTSLGSFIRSKTVGQRLGILLQLNTEDVTDLEVYLDHWINPSIRHHFSDRKLIVVVVAEVEFSVGTLFLGLEGRETPPPSENNERTFLPTPNPPIDNQRTIVKSNPSTNLYIIVLYKIKIAARERARNPPLFQDPIIHARYCGDRETSPKSSLRFNQPSACS